ncbi:ribonuclease G [Marinihelvus fidelis]|uniref:Ribonuclease G n=1 Tax=Marinihelvus fidelis TaxID=2613842 RepID=A0A5N0T5B3_9GAMM|nr:ribonuclease G [Marinihelvus fidelis]KAA9130245.1 ribonuclease G [Marinihelvus fidelis]
MSEEILINVTPTESRVAVVDNGVLKEVWLDRASHYGYLGNIYKGRVSRVLPGMQAAFVDIGLERTAFLHASDIHRVDRERMTGQVPEPDTAERPISELVTEGAEVVVQVVKDPIGTKGARLTTNLSVPSRFLVLLPGSDHIGVSTRIEDEDERARLSGMVSQLRPDARVGYIVRTNAEDVDEFALAADMAFLGKLWDAINERRGEAKPGECIYEDLDLPLRALRDMMHADVERVRIDHTETYEKVCRFVRSFMPDWVTRIERYDAERPIFDLYQIEDEIEQALHRHTPLKSGGYLVIDQTEAMTTIDVNTGGFVGHRTLEETIYKTNLEAAQAIARQLRLRNLGGIIIIDFIDMNDAAHREQVMKTLEKALAQDNVRTSVTGLSDLGLVEMTRKRTRESLGHVMCEPCPVCSGRGALKTAETVCLEIFREIMRTGRQFEASKILVLAPPSVVDLVMDEHSTTIAELEELVDKTIRFQREDQYSQEQYDVVLL